MLAIRFPTDYLLIFLVTIQLVYSWTQPQHEPPRCFPRRSNPHVEEWESDCQFLINHIPSLAGQVSNPATFLRASCGIHESWKPKGAPIYPELRVETAVNLRQQMPGRRDRPLDNDGANVHSDIE